ncbi:VCBS repeat-containing protein [Nocardiopsis sp. YSL2]|uniref:VCBS repeat-containing protein n=1 Tax=Nocardiopsis sp. YSL2 TaxID=2939492 RepID=UPI0026F41E98|nr:VCBS repeat-containing protein [Nocardiopsis sp. YSL2]
MSPHRLAPLAGLLLFLAACGNDPASPPPDGTGEGDPEEVREYDAGSVPEGSGSDTADDVNGDGFADLLFLTDYDAENPDADGLAARDELRRLMIVYGSEDGPDPATRTVLPPKAVLAVSASGRGGPQRPGTADLDGDGFTDIPVRADLGGDPRGGHAVVWGGPTGPDPDAAPTPLAPPLDEDWLDSLLPAVAGDVDGDGAADLVVVQESVTEAGGSLLRVLYGPFDRDGVPARTGRRPLDGWVGALISEPLAIDGGPTRLLIRWGDDGEQPRNSLLRTGAEDPAAWEESDLRAGALAAFADLDGGGGTDLALADNGSRNNEPGFGTEAPEVDHRVNVYPGPSTAAPGDPVSGDLPVAGAESTGYSAHGLAACDLDGDGRGELAIGMNGLGVDLMHVEDGRIEVDSDARLVRHGPQGGPIGTDDETARAARLFSCADYDADGSDELVLVHGVGPYDNSPVRWWVTDGAQDESSFDSADFTS